MRALGHCTALMLLAATPASADNPDHQQELDAAKQACAGQQTVKGLCWSQTHSQMKRILEEQGVALITSETAQDPMFRRTGYTATFNEAGDVIIFECGIFDICQMEDAEAIRALFDSYETLGSQQHHEENELRRTAAQCANFPTEEQICYAHTRAKEDNVLSEEIFFKKNAEATIFSSVR